jgi:hypothetical protein
MSACSNVNDNFNARQRALPVCSPIHIAHERGGAREARACFVASNGTPNLMSGPHELGAQLAANETIGSGDENSHSVRELFYRTATLPALYVDLD